MNNKAKFRVLFLSSKWMIWLDFDGRNKRKYGIGNKKEGREKGKKKKKFNLWGYFN